MKQHRYAEALPLLRGAVLIRFRGRRQEAPEAALEQPQRELPPELAAVLEEQPTRPGRANRVCGPGRRNQIHLAFTILISMTKGRISALHAMIML